MNNKRRNEKLCPAAKVQVPLHEQLLPDAGEDSGEVRREARVCVCVETDCMLHITSIRHVGLLCFALHTDGHLQFHKL